MATLITNATVEDKASLEDDVRKYPKALEIRKDFYKKCKKHQC